MSLEQFKLVAGGEEYSCLIPNPWATELNPSYDPALESECSAAWAKSHGLRYDHLDRCKSALLAAYTMPRVSLRALRIGGRLNTFLIAHDDLYVDIPRPSLAIVADLNEAYEGVLSAEPEPASCGIHLTRMLADIVRDLGELGIDRGPVRDALRAYFAENARELARRETQLRTDLEEYIQHRPTSGGIFIEFELSYLLNRVEMPPWLRSSAAFESIRAASALHVCMANDMLSLPKELESGDTHNVVRIYRDLMGAASFDDAARRVFKDFLVPCVEQVARAEEELDAKLENAIASETDGVRRAIQCLKDWAGGHICWEKGSGRHEHKLARFESQPVGPQSAGDSITKTA